MSELIIFNNPEFGQIRTIEEDGKVLFCGSDVAKALGYKRPKDAVSAHCKGAVKRRTLTNGGEQEMNFIPEGDIYRLAARSELPGADQFERWIFDEVLPSIRKNGGYINGQENMTPEELMAAALIMANKTIENQKVRLSTLTVENQIMQPKADYFDDSVDRNLLTGLREPAKELRIKPKEFISFLLSRKYLYRDKKGKLMPYQVHVNNGLFELKECFSEKTQWTGTQTLVTPKGRETFRLLFLEVG